MKPSWQSVILLLSGLISTAATSTPLQHCALNEVFKTDICFAVSTWKNSTTNQNDISLHISARFPVEATGWAAVGIGPKMNQALMFVMYPGGVEGGMSPPPSFQLSLSISIDENANSKDRNNNKHPNNHLPRTSTYRRSRPRNARDTHLDRRRRVTQRANYLFWL